MTRSFLSIQADHVGPRHNAPPPDGDGDCLLYGTERKTLGPDIEVLVSEDLSLEDARRLLTKCMDGLGFGQVVLEQERQRELFARAGIPDNPPF